MSSSMSAVSDPRVCVCVFVCFSSILHTVTCPILLTGRCTKQRGHLAHLRTCFVKYPQRNVLDIWYLNNCYCRFIRAKIKVQDEVDLWASSDEADCNVLWDKLVILFSLFEWLDYKRTFVRAYLRAVKSSVKVWHFVNIKGFFFFFFYHPGIAAQWDHLSLVQSNLHSSSPTMWLKQSLGVHPSSRWFDPMVTCEECCDRLFLATGLMSSASLGQEKVNAFSEGVNGKVVLCCVLSVLGQ